jgi:hypothetical protein
MTSSLRDRPAETGTVGDGIIGHGPFDQDLHATRRCSGSAY